MNNEFGIDPMKDYLPYVAAFFGWLGSLNWLIIISVCIAAFRAWVAWEEHKLNKRVKLGETENQTDKTTSNKVKAETKE